MEIAKAWCLQKQEQKNGKQRNQLSDCPEDDSLNHYYRANYFLYSQLHPELYTHPSSIGQCWILVNGNCRPICNTLPSLPSNLTIHSLEKNLDDLSSSSDGKSDNDQSEDDLYLE